MILKIKKHCMSLIKINFKGLLLVAITVLLSKLLSNFIYIDAIIISIFLGLIINVLYKPDTSFKPGIAFSEKYLLSFAIILMGANLDFSIINMIETKTLYTIILVIFVSLSSSLALGRIFNLSKSLSLLIGFGNGICGASAIASVSKIIKSKKEDIALSITIINLLGFIGIFIVPFLLNYFFGESIIQKGIIIGSTIQSIAHVTAAGFMVDNQIGEIAILVKMIRILMLGPLLICLTLFFSFYNYNSSKNKSISIPYFIVGFIFFLILSNYNYIPLPLLPLLNQISYYALLFSMAAIGLNLSLKHLITKGFVVFLVGLISFSLEIATAIYFLL